MFALYASIPVSVGINLTRSRLVVEDTVVTKHLASLSGDHDVIILSECGKKYSSKNPSSPDHRTELLAAAAAGGGYHNGSKGSFDDDL